MGGEPAGKVVCTEPVDLPIFIIVIVDCVGHLAFLELTATCFLRLIPVVGRHIAGEVLHRHLEGAAGAEGKGVLERLTCIRAVTGGVQDTSRHLPLAVPYGPAVLQAPADGGPVISAINQFVHIQPLEHHGEDGGDGTGI